MNFDDLAKTTAIAANLAHPGTISDKAGATK
jgi:hypothetical protein